ncbi:hypothetical protein CONLIGDRAFT_599002 [Coniochaeta ligniaria NRRL 30616]|uniref:Solute carrier family 40 member n=1 Tax=Coniochaeta ligniaria NRRL 30616 TaxID=1408157 RepID=A0A1J7IP34_9PEZI|nr:hypothetical protein CONLIGDRAFT_599002 [Coniochaeta ligniaria NRRL 30616]
MEQTLSFTESPITPMSVPQYHVPPCGIGSRSQQGRLIPQTQFSSSPIFRGYRPPTSYPFPYLSFFLRLTSRTIITRSGILTSKANKGKNLMSYTPGSSTHPSRLTRGQAWNLYVSHALSTWNARGYEFAVILFTAEAYPNTLQAASLRTVIVYSALILFSSSVGRWVEISPDRLKTLSTTIIINRGSVILASVFWLLILVPTHDPEELDGPAINPLHKAVYFMAAIGLGIVERLSSSANLISMERDWVVTVAAPPGEAYDLTHLNAIMRRIDLVCKLIPPIFISGLISVAGSMRFGVIFTGLSSMTCLPIELVSARRTWNANAALQARKATPSTDDCEQEVTGKRGVIARLGEHFLGFRIYFSSSVWIPSMALAILHYNVMTWRATFITWLINVGYSLNFITLARTVGSVFEILSTVVTPIGVAYLGRDARQTRRHIVVDSERDSDETQSLLQNPNTGNKTDRGEQTVTGLKRLGFWGITWQIINLVPVFVTIWSIIPNPTTSHDISTPQPSIGPSVVLFGFLASSRLGVWVFDITTQQLTQTLVAPDERSSFAGAENSVVNVFELAGALSAILFSQIGQYKWLAMASLITVGISWAMYFIWLHTMRRL